MAITTSICNSFLRELLLEGHNISSDTLKLALIKESESGTYNDTTTSYDTVVSNSDEASGTNYSAGGVALTNVSVGSLSDTQAGNRAFFDADDVVFTNVTVTASGAILYNDTASGNPAIAVFDFDPVVSATSGNLTVTLPGPGTAGSAAIVRIANS